MCWCERLPDLLVARVGGIVVRFVFDLLGSVPAEFIVPAREPAIHLLHLTLVKGYRIGVDSSLSCCVLVMCSIAHVALEYPESRGDSDGAFETAPFSGFRSHSEVAHTPDSHSHSETLHTPDSHIDSDIASDFPELSQFRDAIDKSSHERLLDLARVVTDALLSFYGAPQQTARALVEEIYVTLHEGEVIDAFTNELKQRIEFGKVNELPPQIQMRSCFLSHVTCSIYSTMEMCLRLHVFAVTDSIVVKVVQEAAKPFDTNSTNDAIIKSVSPTDCVCLYDQ